MYTKFGFIFFLVLFATKLFAQNEVKYAPEVHGFTLLRYEQNTNLNTGRFVLKNARFNVTGAASEHIKYRTDVTFNADGSFRLLDAFANIAVSPKLSLKVGAMKTLLSNEFIRPSVEACFSNFSYICTNVASDMYDIGANLTYENKEATPFSLSAGFHNGFAEYFNSKTPQHDGVNLALRASVEPINGLSISASFYNGRSFYNINPFKNNVFPALFVDPKLFYTQIISGDIAFKRNGFLIEAEFLQRSIDYRSSLLDKFNKTAFYLMSQYEFQISGTLKSLIPAVRYDSFDDNNSFSSLNQDRITVGTTFCFSKYSYSDVRINYEKALSSNSSSDVLSLDLLIRF